MKKIIKYNKKILLCNSDYECTLASARSFGKKGLYVIVAYNTKLSITNYSKYVAEIVPCPEINKEHEFVSWLLTNAKNHKFDVFFPTSDILVWYTLKYRDELSKYIKIKLPSEKALESVLLKDVTYKMCMKWNVPTPLSVFPKSKEELKKLSKKIKYPVVIKPKTHVCLIANKKGVVIFSKEKFLKLYKLNRLKYSKDKIVAKYPYICWPIVQEYIPKVYENIYLVSGFVNDDNRIVAITSDKKVRQRPTIIGIGVYVENYYDKELIDLAIRFIRGIKYTGIFAIEFIKDQRDGKYKLIDFNPRTHHFIQLEIDKGIDLPNLWYGSLYHKVKPKRNIYVNKDIRFIQLFSDLINMPGQIFLRKEKIKNVIRYFNSLIRARSFAVFDRTDLKPFFIDIIIQLKQILRHPRGYIRSIFKGE